MTVSQKSNKVLVIGLDGLSPLLVEKWIKELPTIKRFKDEGWFGLSTPPTPAQTPVAWTTFMTGKNPGKHGIFSFAMRDNGTYKRRIADPQSMKSETLWRILSDYQKRVGVINVPMAMYEDVDGFIIPGFLASHEGVPQPMEAQRMIQDRFGLERISGDIETSFLQKVKNEPEAFFKRINQITDEQTKVSLHLMQHLNWDFCMLVYLGSDRIQHFFWKYVDERHPEYQKGKFTEQVKNYYIKLDQIVGKFLDATPKDTLTILLSDHGFCPVWKEVIINNYLEELGFLKLKDEKIDLENSKAVSYGYGDIWLNVKGREPKGQVKPGGEYAATVDNIKNSLQQVRIDGEKPFKEVKKKEEIYWGNCINKAADLTVIFNVGWQAARRPEITKKSKSKRYVNDHPMWSGGHDGTHDPADVPGIVGIIGPQIQDPKKIMVHLYDVAPTILNFFDVPIPADMDGKSLQIKA